MSPPPVTGGSAELDICSTIRNRVSSGELLPGDRLTEDAVATEFGVSRIPVREAIRELVGQGFLYSRPNYGTFVSEVDPSEAANLLAIRSVLEPLAARQAAEHRTEQHLADLRLLVEEGRAAAAAGDFPRVVSVNSRFHDAIAVSSGNPTLTDMIRQIRFRTDRFNTVDIPGRAESSLWEHEEIVRALEQGNGLRAARLAALHADEPADVYRQRIAERSGEG